MLDWNVRGRNLNVWLVPSLIGLGAAIAWIEGHSLFLAIGLSIAAILSAVTRLISANRPVVSKPFDSRTVNYRLTYGLVFITAFFTGGVLSLILASRTEGLTALLLWVGGGGALLVTLVLS